MFLLEKCEAYTDWRWPARPPGAPARASVWSHRPAGALSGPRSGQWDGQCYCKSLILMDMHTDMQSCAPSISAFWGLAGAMQAHRRAI